MGFLSPIDMKVECISSDDSCYEISINRVFIDTYGEEKMHIANIEMLCEFLLITKNQFVDSMTQFNGKLIRRYCWTDYVVFENKEDCKKAIEWIEDKVAAKLVMNKLNV